jgi:uncharacterized coiled-coil protein SlyX
MLIVIQVMGATALLGLNALLVYWLWRVRRDYRDELACGALVARLCEREATIRAQDARLEDGERRLAVQAGQIRAQWEQLVGLEAAIERLRLTVRAFGGRDGGE